MRKETITPELCVRIHAEFREMPGLTLTLSQAARLFSLGPADCERVLQSLVEEGHLTTNGRTFASASGGRHWTPLEGRGEPAATQWRLAGG
jgi:hypothetical protein